MSVVTVLGATGFIGSHLVAELRGLHREVLTPGRGADLGSRDLGVVFYCIGLTSDFRKRPYDTVAAHVSNLSDLLQRGRFQRLIYLSSTRLYGSGATAVEDNPVLVNPSSPDHLYNISKAMGESLALQSGRDTRVVRLSNVYGDDFYSENFLPSLIKAALRDGTVVLATSPHSAKDYVHVRDVVRALVAVGFQGRHRTYNIASGRNVTNGAILNALARLTGCTVDAKETAPLVAYPEIDISRARAEFDFLPSSVLDDLPEVVTSYRLHRELWQK